MMGVEQKDVTWWQKTQSVHDRKGRPRSNSSLNFSQIPEANGAISSQGRTSRSLLTMPQLLH